MDIIIYAVVGLLLLGVGFAVYQLRHRWNAWHLVFHVFLFLMTVLFLVMAAASLKTRTTWLKQQAELSQQLERQQSDHEKLLYGDLTEIRQTEASLRRVRGQLERTMADRGRVWRECSPQELTADSITLSTLRPGLDPAQAPANGIAVKDVLYAFKEAQRDGQLVPTVYLGEFTVVDRTDHGVKLAPVLPLDPVQASVVQTPGTWSLYDMVPVDDHRALAADPDARISLELDGPLFEQWDSERLSSFFSEPVGLYLNAMPELLNQEMFQELLQGEFLRDGMILSEEEVRAGGAELADNTWIKIRFTRPWRLTVDEVNANPQSALTGGYFDATGRAVVGFLRRAEGEDIEFKVDDLAVFDSSKARELIGQGIAEQVAPYYVRPLIDYARTFHYRHVRSQQLDNDIEGVKRNLAALEEAKKKSESQIAFRQQERAKLMQDRTMTFAERDAVAQYQATLTDELQQLRDALNKLVRENAALAAQLAQIQTPSGVAVTP